MTEDPLTISILCANVHSSNHITHSILQTTKHDAHIIIITEPWIGTVRAETQEKGTVHHQLWHCIMPPNTSEARVSVYYRKNLPFRVVPLMHSPFTCNHIIPFHIVVPDKPPILVLAIYNSPTTFDSSSLLQSLQIPDEPTIICGDFNLHSPDWDNSVSETNNQTELFQDWMAENFLGVLNDPDKPTYHGHHFEYGKVDDLVVANLKLYEEYDISPIQVHSDKHFASDHYPISFKISTTATPEDFKPQFIFSENRQKEWLEHLIPQLTALHQLAPVQPSQEDLDTFAQNLINCFESSTTSTMKKTTASNHSSNHWWNDDLTHALAEL